MKGTFTSEALVREMKSAAAAGKTRGEVVVNLMTAAGVEVTDVAKAHWYNNVSQRIKALTEAGLTLPVLAAGKRGGGRGKANLDALKAILAE